MRAISDAMRAKMATGRTTFCTCFRFVLNGNTSLLVNNLDRDLTIGGQVYKSAPALRRLKYKIVGSLNRQIWKWIY